MTSDLFSIEQMAAEQRRDLQIGVRREALARGALSGPAPDRLAVVVLAVALVILAPALA